MHRCLQQGGRGIEPLPLFKVAGAISGYSALPNLAELQASNYRACCGAKGLLTNLAILAPPPPRDVIRAAGRCICALARLETRCALVGWRSAFPGDLCGEAVVLSVRTAPC